MQEQDHHFHALADPYRDGENFHADVETYIIEVMI